MLTYREITPQDEQLVMPRVEQFYRSDAVDHPVPRQVMLQAFQAAADPKEPLLRGVLVLEGDRPAGYLYLTQCYSAEVGGRCIFLEELFLGEEFRGRGLGGEILRWILAQYPDALRFRLEVTPVNEGASRLYEKTGFHYLDYRQMVLDRER